MMLGRMGRAALMIAVVLGATGVVHAAKPVYAQVRFQSPGAPVIYLRFDQARLYLATSAQALSKAKAILPAAGDAGDTGVSFAPVDLPVTAPGISKTTVGLIVERDIGEHLFVIGDFTVRRRDKTGASWEYAYTAAGEVKGATSPQQPYIIKVPSFESYTLGIETKVEKGKVGIGLQLKADGQDIREAKRGGKPAAARFEVLDAKGKVIHKATGDLDKFGFT